MKKIVLSMMMLVSFAVSAHAVTAKPSVNGPRGVCGEFCINKFDCAGGPGFGCGSCVHGTCVYLDPQTSPLLGE